MSPISSGTPLNSAPWTAPVRTDMRKVRRRKQDMVEREIAFHLEAYKASGAELIMGEGRFVGPKTIEVATERRRNAQADWRSGRCECRQPRRHP